MPEIISATYQIVTPMFIGDAEQKASDITPASVKGALRFWWRALNWGRIRQNHNSDEEALTTLHQQEGELFGSALEKGAGQAKFMMSLDIKHCITGKPDNPGSGIQYLLGQGLYNYKTKFLRNAILSGELEIQLLLKPQASLEQSTQLCNTLKAFGFLGGLGARARKGFGSVAIQSLSLNGQTQPIPINKADLKTQISQWLDTMPTNLPPFTAFSTKTRIDLSLTGNSSLSLLEMAGTELQMYRSWGKDDKVNQLKAEQNFQADHDEMLAVTMGTNPTQMPKRSVFGLPHNYFFSSSNQKVDIAPGPGGDRNRRASPLFIHLHQFPDKTFVLIQTLLPAKFLYEGEAIEFLSNRRNYSLEFKETDIDWAIIHRYLNRFQQREELQ